MFVADRRRRQVLSSLVGLYLACGAGCDRPNRATARGSEAPVQALETAPARDEEAIAQLRALAYVGWSAPRPGETGSGVVRREPPSFPGYNFFVVPRLGTAVLMDGHGRPVNVWRGDPPERWASAELLDSGEVLITGTAPGAVDPEAASAGRFLLKLSWHGQTLWRREYPAHHAVAVLPDGRLLTLTARYRAIPAIHPTAPIRDNALALLSAAGEELDSLSLYDLFAGAPDLAPLLPVPPSGGSPDIDLFHANSVEQVDPEKDLPSKPLYSPDNVLVCVRHQDLILMVSWKTRRIVWAWGRGELSSPHDARLLPGGHILVFDNGLARGKSRVVELDPPTGAVVWQYEAPPGESFYTRSRGSNQRLPNGNTLIADSDNGRAFEVTPAGRIVWEFLNPLRNAKGERAALYRMTRIDQRVIAAIVTRHGPGRVPAQIAAAFGP